MADLVVTLSGDEAKLFRAQQKIIQQQLEMETGYTDVERAAKKASNEAKKDADQAEANAKRVNKAYADQLASIEQQITAIKSGNAAATEQKAIYEGLSAEQAKSLAAARAQADASKDEADDAKKIAADKKRISDQAIADSKALDRQYDEQTESLKLQLVELTKGKAAAVEMRATQQGLTAEQATHIRQLHEQVESQKKLNDATKNQESLAGSIGNSITSWATGFLTVTAAAGTFTKALDNELERSHEILQAHLDIAKAQQEAAKNLAGVSAAQISETLQKEIPKIALEASFKDIPKLTTALGSSASIVGDAKAPSVVSAAAKLERLTPENLQTTATSLADLVKATGVQTADEAAALLLSSGSVARPEELPKLSVGAAQAANAGALFSPKQDRVEAAKESAALFATLTAVDKNGNSAATATVQLMSQLRAVLVPRDALDDVNGKIQKLENKSKLSKSQTDSLNNLRAVKTELESRIDPGTTIGRLNAIQSDEKLKGAFLDHLMGEAIFKPLFEDLTDPTSKKFKELEAALKTVSTDVKVFDDALKTLDITPQQKIANATAKAETAVAVQQFGDNTAATTAAISDISTNAFKNTSSGVVDGIANQVYGLLLYSARNNLSTEGYAHDAVVGLQERRSAIQRRPQTQENLDRVRVLDDAIASIKTLQQEAAEQSKKSSEALQSAAQNLSSAADKTLDANGNKRRGAATSAAKEAGRP